MIDPPIPVWTVAWQRNRWLGHVLAFGFDTNAMVWVVIDPHWHAMDVQVLRPDQFDEWRRREVPGCRQLRIRAGRAPFLLTPGLWCVGVVKRLVGLRSGAFTPGGLWRDLVKAGAQEVGPHEGQGPRAVP